MDGISLGETVEYIKSLKQRLRQLEKLNVALESDAGSFRAEDIQVVSSGLYSPTQDMTQAVPEDEDTLSIEVVRNDCNQEDTALNLFSCLRDLNLTVTHASVSTNVYRIHATIKVKMPNDSSSDQLNLCSEIEDALQRCLP
ncbi:hypothetical protein R1sor_021338 [Riccia sorocarpa]|uniref:BHLH transcription factor n=1 Tax=Riccia sorocarpa TaxID=122646 RepID=A0ABD3GJP9_9MARC